MKILKSKEYTLTSGGIESFLWSGGLFEWSYVTSSVNPQKNLLIKQDDDIIQRAVSAFLTATDDKIVEIQTPTKSLSFRIINTAGDYKYSSFSSYYV